MFRPLIELLVSAGYGLLSSVVPVFNSEVFIAAARVGSLAGVISVGLGLGLGQAAGKIGLFWAVRHGSQWPFVERLRRRAQRRRQRRDPDRPWRRFTAAVGRASDRLVGLAGDARWGVPVLTLSAVTGFPPVVAMPVIMAPSRMRTWVFSLVCLLGMTARFVVLALVIDGVADSLLPH